MKDYKLNRMSKTQVLSTYEGLRKAVFGLKQISNGEPLEYQPMILKLEEELEQVEKLCSYRGYFL